MVLKVAIACILFWHAAPTAQTQTGSRPPASSARDLIVEGELETYVAVGGESTGWRLRRRNEQGQREYIEVLVTAELAQGLRANTRVQVRGTMQTRRYVERGEVQVLAAKEVIEVARRR